MHQDEATELRRKRQAFIDASLESDATAFSFAKRCKGCGRILFRATARGFLRDGQRISVKCPCNVRNEIP